MTQVSDEMQPIGKPPWRPRSWEAKVRSLRFWYAFAEFYVGSWAIGFGFDGAPTSFAIHVGPLSFGGERDEPPPENYDAFPDWSWTLKRIVIGKWKLELRFEFDLNIWLFGYMLADLHDHGIYLGPFNVQIEYDKFQDRSWPRPGDAFGFLLKAFLVWLEGAAPRISIAARPSGCTEQRIALSFEGINPAIGAFLTCWELVVFVNWEGRNWDVLLNLDARPRRLARGGYTCECCKRQNRRTFPSLDAFWRDHLFEPLLVWVNGELAAADVIGLYGSPSDGYTYAKLLPKNDPGEIEPHTCIPVRARRQA
jgi:hypothetical protein